MAGGLDNFVGSGQAHVPAGTGRAAPDKPGGADHAGGPVRPGHLPEPLRGHPGRRRARRDLRRGRHRPAGADRPRTARPGLDRDRDPTGGQGGERRGPAARPAGGDGPDRHRRRVRRRGDLRAQRPVGRVAGDGDPDRGGTAVLRRHAGAGHRSPAWRFSGRSPRAAGASPAVPAESRAAREVRGPRPVPRPRAQSAGSPVPGSLARGTLARARE